MKNLLLGLFLIFILFACSNHEKNIKTIGTFVSENVRELKQLQLDSSKRYKEYNFEGQKFIIYFDSTGKPIFVNRNFEKLEFIVLKINDNDYKVKLENGILEVESY